MYCIYFEFLYCVYGFLILLSEMECRWAIFHFSDAKYQAGNTGELCSKYGGIMRK